MSTMGNTRMTERIRQQQSHVLSEDSEEEKPKKEKRMMSE
jgi:hypothetical protein